MFFRNGLYLLIISLTFGTKAVTSRTCNKVDSCTCAFDDNNAQVNLWSLAKTSGAPLFSDIYATDGAYYSYNPCVEFNEDDCHNAAFCKRSSSNSTASLLADQRNVDFGYDGTKVQLTYTPGGLGNIVTVSFICVAYSPPLFTPYGFDNSTRQYHFKVETKCACENGCYVAPVSSGISTGSILLIIFFVVLFLYLTFGSINGKFVSRNSGLQVLPHYEFWMGFPGLVKDGCLLAIGFACCKASSKKTYDNI